MHDRWHHSSTPINGTLGDNLCGLGKPERFFASWAVAVRYERDLVPVYQPLPVLHLQHGHEHPRVFEHGLTGSTGPELLSDCVADSDRRGHFNGSRVRTIIIFVQV